MKRVVRRRRVWVIAAAALAIGGTLVSLLVLARQGEELTVTPYSDVLRFEAAGVASLQVQIFDLSGKLLWDSGVVSGQLVDWDRTDQYGERLAYGAYLYLVQGWDSAGALVLKKTGKLALLPGDKLQLQQAPPLTGVEINPPISLPSPAEVEPKWTSPDTYVSIVNPSGSALLRFYGHDTGYGTGDIQFVNDSTTIARVLASSQFHYVGFIGIGSTEFRVFTANASGSSTERLRIAGGVDTASVSFLNSQVGIGTTSPVGKMDIRNTAYQPALHIEASDGINLIEAYNTGSGSATGCVFRVERETGNVRADGAFYGAGFYSGSADVAEHINVSEPVEPGDVVEIDPASPGHFRKARGPYSKLVAGIISTDPGVVLGSSSDPVEGEGDPRPMLALAGRVQVKATTENGPIHVGDLLVAASKPGYAMKCDDASKAAGAVVGKALEALEKGEGVILIQVTLR